MMKFLKHCFFRKLHFSIDKYLIDHPERRKLYYNFIFEFFFPTQVLFAVVLMGIVLKIYLLRSRSSRMFSFFVLGSCPESVNTFVLKQEKRKNPYCEHI